MSLYISDILETDLQFSAPLVFPKSPSNLTRSPVTASPAVSVAIKGDTASEEMSVVLSNKVKKKHNCLNLLKLIWIIAGQDFALFLTLFLLRVTFF